jgi:hypothetical protein
MTEVAALPDIDTMEAGPEMDAGIAQKVMGQIVERVHKLTAAGIEKPWAIRTGTKFSPIPPYSTDDAAALEVFRRVVASEVGGKRVWRLTFGDGGWSCTWEYDSDGADAPTFALAICRAALKASLI